jgi:hypothetical protein
MSGAIPALTRVQCEVLPDGRMHDKEAAKYIGRKPQTLANWRARNYGPRWIRVGGRIFYYLDDVDEFIRGGETASSPEMEEPRASAVSSPEMEQPASAEPAPRRQRSRRATAAAPPL